ncbi:hypothetical protein E2562_029749 [Oryza meyeriana var. granulata]|uniref:Uncharacterized protein n=1 Tax=Oryza meyeriana var. granulata TaxID=110450 RepID=A0A6G1CJA8_9ORYZ|nr:hypothetical protein E2562_029749 [Oryza meyeriana var. granulata]
MRDVTVRLLVGSTSSTPCRRRADCRTAWKAYGRGSEDMRRIVRHRYPYLDLAWLDAPPGTSAGARSA